MGDFTLQLSNERIELENEESLPSSASSFEPILSPTLDLNFLTYLRADDISCALKNFQIDSAPLTYIKNEEIEFNLIMSTDIANSNGIYGEDQVSADNKRSLIIKTTDYQASTNSDMIEYFNRLLTNQLNTYILARYLQLVCDDFFFIENAFEDLNYDKKSTLSFNELSLLGWYTDLAKFSRLTTVGYLNQLVNPSRSMTTLIEKNHFRYSDKKYSQAEEHKILSTSVKLKSKEERENASVLKIIDVSEFYNHNLSEQTQESIQARSVLMNLIREKSRNRLIDMGVYQDRGVIPEHFDLVEKMIKCNLKLLKIGQFAINIINQEKSKHEREPPIMTVLLTDPPTIKKSKLSTSVFSPDFVQIEPDSSKQKCRFIISKEKIFTDKKTTFELKIPKYLSYKLGSSKNFQTGEYEKIQIGPVNSNKNTTNIYKNISNLITSEDQRLSSVMRCQPRLICLCSDVFEQSGRAQEKDIFFSKNQDFITIYNQPYKKKELENNFLFKKNIEIPRYFKLERSKSILQGIKIKVTDENGECLQFTRNTITQVTLGFKPSIISE